MVLHTTPRKGGCGMKSLIPRHLDEWNGIQVSTTADPETPVVGAPAPEPPFGTEPPIYGELRPSAHFI